jgi:sulfonate transport system permease protein
MTSVAEIPSLRAADDEALTPTAKRRRRLGRRPRIPFGRLLGVLVLLGIWSLASAAGALDPRKLSAPWTVLQTGFDLISDGTLQTNIGASLYRVALGFAVGVLIGTGLALIAGLSRVGEALVDGPIQVKRSIPLLGLAPLMILWLGIGEEFKIVLIATGVAGYMYVQTHAALIAIDNRYVELAEVVGLSRLGFVRKVVIPGALPGFFVGLRLSASIAWLTLVVVEEVNAQDGLGKMIFRAQDYGQSDVILVGLAVYGIFGFASDAVIRILERKVLSWRRTLAS